MGAEVFLNGSSAGTATWDRNIENTGSKFGSGYGYFKGKISEVRVYNSTLATTDIEKFYMKTNPTFTIGAEEDNLPDIPIIININKREIIFPSRLIIYTKVNQLTT